MSQSTLLQDVMTWDERRCKEELNDALPHLICDFTNAGSVDQRLATLKALSCSFMPVINFSQLEKKLFANVLPMVTKLFDASVDKIQSCLNVSNKNINEAGLVLQLKVLMELVDTLVLFVNHASKSADVKFEHIKSLPRSTVHVIKQSFEHCKISNALYGDFFQCVSEHLMQLFKKAHQLQKALIALMDLLPLTTETPNECVKQFVQVCDAFHDVCCIVGKMDSALMVATWKFLVKLITKHKEYLRHQLDVSAFVSSLCTHIQDGFEGCLEHAPTPSTPDDPRRDGAGDEKAFQRSLKICHLSAKMLMHLIKEYGPLAMLKPNTLYQMLLTFYSKSPPSLKAPELTKQSHECLTNSLLVCTEPILQLICSERLFCSLVTRYDNNISADHEFAQCLLLIAIMKQLPSCDDETQAMWLVPMQAAHNDPMGSVLEVMFAAISECFSELTLPVELAGVRFTGKQAEAISFHQYLVTHISAYVASVQSKHFHLVESVLLKWSLSAHSHVALVAMDVWCFLARYSSADVCNMHVRCLVQVLSSVSTCYYSVQHTHLSILVGRLAAFMGVDHQAQLVGDFPPLQYPSVWSYLPLSAFKEEKQQRIRDDIISASNKSISQWLSGTEHQTFSNVYSLCCHVAALNNVYRTSSVSKQQHSGVIQNVEKLWSSLDIECIKDHVILILLIHLSSYLLSHLKNRTVIKVLDQLKEAICVGVDSGVMLAIVAFIGNMGKLTFSNENEDDCATVDDIISRIASMFSRLLADTCYMVHQQALVVFSEFAEETLYESIVTDSLADDVTQATVVQFLQQIPYGVTDSRQTEITKLALQKELIKNQPTHKYAYAVLEETTTMSTESKEAIDIAGIISTTEREEVIEPAAKRSRGEHDDVKLRKIITKVEECVSSVETVKQEAGGLPGWFKHSVKDIGQKLTDICS